MSLRFLLLNPVIVGAAFLVLVPLVVWRVRRFLSRSAPTADRGSRVVAVFVAVTLLDLVSEKG